MNQTPWGIDQLNEQIKLIGQIPDEQRQIIEEECALFAQCFSTDAGRKVLDILRNKLDGVTWNPAMGANYGYYNEGQNDVLRYIINRVNYRRDK